MSDLRKEYELRKERRKRAVEGLVKEAVINVLAEQQLDLSGGAKTQAPVQAEPAQPQQQAPAPEQDPPPVATPDETVPQQYTVDDMIRELNAIRSGRSFTDPEIYGRLVTFFKGLGDEDRVSLDNLLTQIAELVTGVEDALENQQQQGGQSAQPQPQPPAEAPQQAAPMPGAQQAAGAAGVGQA